MSQTFPLWEKIFSAMNFDVSKDLHFITAKEIKQITNHEPRNMAKMDSSADLPPVFKRHGYFLLPVENGRYAIVRGEGFHDIEKRLRRRKHLSRIPFPLATAGRGSGEMQYLDYGVNAGALEEVVGEKSLYPCIRGREYTKDFSFSVRNSLVQVSSVQIEVDLGLEGPNSIYLIEAKVNTPRDFIIRQLYYPYRNFKILAAAKKIVPIFFTYDVQSKSYNFWVYEFIKEDNYNSIKLVKRKSFEIVTQNVVRLSKLKPHGNVRSTNLIPQANDINKIIALAHKVSEGVDNYRDIANYFQFKERQSSYYREAAEALNLVYSEGGKYHLTELGEELVRLPSDEKNVFLTQLLLNFKLVKLAFNFLQEKGVLDKNSLENIIRENSNLSGSTPGRRADSLFSWLRWIAGTTHIFHEEDKVFKLSN